MKLPYDAVLFDLDGTLFDAEKGITLAFRATLNALGIACPEEKDLRFVVGPPLRASFRECDVPEDRIETACDLYRETFYREGIPAYSVYPYIRQLLGLLRKNGVYVAVATSKPTDLTKTILRRFRLLNAFDNVVGEQAGAVKKGKEELIRQSLPASFRRAAMVGDRSFDMEGARANGIDAIGVGYGCGSEDELRGAGADAYVSSVRELISLLCPDCPLPRGFFLTVEGPDGSGKTTQVDLLEKNLRQYGFDVLRTREPGGTPISEKIRHIILDPGNMEMCDTCEALLYAASRAQHVHQVIRPAVEAGRLVLCDRFADSSVAYQGGGRGLGVSVVQKINAPAIEGMHPDATLYLSIDAETALSRRYAASSPDRLELADVTFHQSVQHAYEHLIAEEPDRFLCVDASRDIQSIASDALSAVLARILPEEAYE